MMKGGIVDKVAPPTKGGAFFMLTHKTVFFSSIKELDASVNEVLSTISKEEFYSIEVKEEKGLAFILYEKEEPWKNALCCDCQYWDDQGETSTSGLCHECGQRRRFNCKACKSFKDVRG